MKNHLSGILLKKIILVFFLVINVSFIFAQTKIVTGVVTNESGDPLPGTSVIIEGTQEGVASDANGIYSIEASENEKLTFSFVGMVDQTITIGAGNIYDITLIESSVGIEDVVVIGYGTVRKKDLTGAVSVIDTDQIENRRSTDLAGSIQGLAPGVKVTSSGMAGGMSSVIIRGVGNLTNNAPLYIIDGVPSNAGLTLNMADIESIQILKDASSAAIYGSRAANGVIIVTTKKGHDGALKVEYSGQLSYNWIPVHDLLSREEWVKFDDMAYDNAIEAGLATKRQSHFPYTTDWQEELFDPGMKQNHNISLSGGNKNGQYYISYNKMNDEGTLNGQFYDRNSFRINTSGKKGNFSYGQNFRFMSDDWDGFSGSPFLEVISIAPTIPIYDPNNHGGFGFGDPDSCNTYANNPIAKQEIDNVTIRNTYVSGNVYGQVEFLKMFTYKINVGYTANFGVNDHLRKSGSWTMGQADDPAFLGKVMSRFGGFLLENTLDFKKTFGNHKIEALAGITYQDENSEDLNATKYAPLLVGDKYFRSLYSATGDDWTGGGYGESALLSYFGRVNYIYADKYLLNLTVRRDGTSRLPLENRWGNFPSVSGAWRISKEDFFNVPFISDLKIRANYGILGNSNIGYWDYIAVMNTAPRAVFGIPEHMDRGVIQSKLVNRNITWEKQIQTNIGVDIAFFENKLTMSAEYFISESRDLLVALPILATTGNNGGEPIVNAGSLENTGLEFDIHWREKVGDLTYGASLNFSRIRNKVLDLGYGKTEQYTSLSKTEIGQPLGSFYLYKMLGIFDTDEEILAHVNSEGIVIQPDAVPGDIKYDDYDDNGDISSTDRQIVGSPWPKFEAGMSLFAKWKGFDVNILGHGRFGQMIWNGSRATAGDFNQSQNNFVTLNPWTEANMDTDQPRIVFGDTKNSRGDQDRWLEDGSFFRISEISFGYTIPDAIIKKAKMDKLRLGISFNNLITFTNYKGLDPDFYDNGIFTMSADYNAYPNTRSVMASLTIGF